MSKRSVSLAIDHGTTNSCIARMTPKGPEVIEVDASSGILPSAVHYDSKGRLLVGAAARQAIATKLPPGQGFTGYKLHIGSDRRYEFKSCNKTLTSPEL